MPISKRILWDLGLFSALMLLGLMVVRGWIAESREPQVVPSQAPRKSEVSVSPPDSLPPSQPSETNLLPRVDLERNSAGAPWTRGPGGEIQSPYLKHARVEIGCRPPQEYDVRADVLRRSPNDALALGLVVAGRQVLVILDGNGAGASWIEVRNGSKGLSDQGITYFDGSVLKLGRPASILCRVRKDRMTVSVDDYAILDWRGDAERLFVPAAWEVDRKDVLFLGAYETVFHVTRLSIAPVTGTIELLK